MNSTNGSISLQLPIWSNTHARSRSSNDWIVLSDWPSVWGWYAELIRNWVPKAACRDYQKWEVILGSLSDTMLAGTPCSLTISLTYNFASLSIENFWLMARKWAHLVNLSTITHIESFPLVDLGRWVTKSMTMLSHFHWGMSSGCNVPPGLWCSIFAFWHTKHDATKSATSVFISFYHRTNSTIFI